MEEASDIGSVARMIPIRSMAYWAARREDNASPPSSLTSASGATPKSAVKSTAGRGAARSVDSLALPVIRWLTEVDRCIGCPSPSKTTISVKARFAVHSRARGGIPLPVETDLDRHRYAPLAPSPMRAPSAGSRAVTPRGWASCAAIAVDGYRPYAVGRSGRRLGDKAGGIPRTGYSDSLGPPVCA